MSPLHPDNANLLTKSKTNLATFKEDLTKAIQGAFPTGRMPYNRVRVVFVRWDADDTGSEKSIQGLQTLFESYGYACRTEILQAQASPGPDKALRKIMYDLAEAGESKDLSIFYYAGHGQWDSVKHSLQLQ
jgi:hypothetical protein